MKKFFLSFLITILGVIFQNHVNAQMGFNPKGIIFVAKLEKKLFKKDDSIKLTLTIKNENNEEFILERINLIADFDINLVDNNGKNFEMQEDVKNSKNPDFHSTEMLYFEKNRQLTWQIDNLKDYFKDIGIGKYKLKVSRKYYIQNTEKTLFSNEIKFKVVK